MHAVARVLLDGVIHNVQVSWVKMGVEACQTMLNGGANDFGGTLMEETISRMAGAEWGIRMEPSEIRDAITSIGRTPVERSTTYERVAAQRERASVAHASMAPLEGRDRRSNTLRTTVSVKEIDRTGQELDHRNSSHNPLHLRPSTYSIALGTHVEMLRDLEFPSCQEGSRWPRITRV